MTESQQSYVNTGMWGIGMIGGSGLDAMYRREGARWQNKQEEEAARRQQQWNIDQWQRNNNYNTPKAQMERFKEAGLNPNLMYGQGDNGNAAPVATYQRPRYANELTGNPFTEALQAMNLMATNNNIKAQTLVAKEQAANVAADTVGKFVNNRGNEMRNNVLFRNQDNLVNELQAKVLNIMEDTSLKYHQGNLAYRRGETEYQNEKLKEWEVNLSKKGLTPRDAFKARAINAVLQTPAFKKMLKNIEGAEQVMQLLNLD